MHVLSLPPAFVLSQDQTLKFMTEVAIKKITNFLTTSISILITHNCTQSHHQLTQTLSNSKAIQPKSQTTPKKTSNAKEHTLASLHVRYLIELIYINQINANTPTRHPFRKQINLSINALTKTRRQSSPRTSVIRDQLNLRMYSSFWTRSTVWTGRSLRVRSTLTSVPDDAQTLMARGRPVQPLNSSFLRKNDGGGFPLPGDTVQPPVLPTGSVTIL